MLKSVIIKKAEPVRREPTRQYSTYHNRGHNRVRVQSPVNNNSSTTSDSDNNDNAREHRNSHSLAKNPFCPDLLHSCPAHLTQSTSPADSHQPQSAQLHEEDYVEIDEIRQTVSTLSIDNNDPFNTNSTNFPHRFAEGNAICVDPSEPLKQAMGQSLSQRRPKISLTWVLRGEQQPVNPSTIIHVDGPENRTREKKKFRSKSKDTGERLFSEKYITEVEKIGDSGLNNKEQRAVSELLYVCSKNAGESSSIDGYASDRCGSRNERCRRSDKQKISSKFSMIKNNLNHFAPEKSDHFKDKTIALNGESAFCDGNRSDVNINGEYIKPTYSEPSLCTEGQSRRHRHRRRRNRSQRFGYEIRNVDDFLSKCSLSSPGNIPVVLSSSSTLYQTKPGGYQIEIPLPLGMVVNAVFKNQNWLYVQTPHAEEGYVCYKYIMPLGIIPHMRSTSTVKPPCWETSGFPKPCGNMTDSEKEIQLRGGTRSEGARTPRLRRTTKQCGEKNFDLLYLRAASQPKLQEKSYAQLKSTSKMCKSTTASSEKPNDDYVLLQHKKPPMYPQNGIKPIINTRNSTRSLRQTLLAVTENFVSTAISVKKGDVVTLLACKQIQDKRLQQPIQWFFVRSRDGQEGFIPAEVAGHGFL
ncbi:hypothetical protein HA402_015248 [Bradysia odoriphaga]|nr:hypothetical protein HA402_015248 [Bradysia odoriphaga]